MEGGENDRLSDRQINSKLEVTEAVRTQSGATGAFSTQSIVTAAVKAATEDEKSMRNNKQDLYGMHAILIAKIAADCKEEDCCIYYEDQASHTLKKTNDWKYTSGETNIQLYFKTKPVGELHLWKEVVTVTQT